MPRLSSRSSNIVETKHTLAKIEEQKSNKSKPNSPPAINPPSPTVSNVKTKGLTAVTKVVDDGASPPSPTGSTASQPLLNKRSRAVVSFHCSPFETGSVRVAATSAPQQLVRNNTTIDYSTPYGWVPPIVKVRDELGHRMDPTHPLPPVPQRQYHHWETIEGHWRNDQRTEMMKRLHHINSNEMLAKMYYGSKDEIDGYK